MSTGKMNEKSNIPQLKIWQIVFIFPYLPWFSLILDSLTRDMEQARLIGDAFARSEFDEVKRLYKAAMVDSNENMYCSYANSGVAFVISMLTLAPVSLNMR